MKTTPKRRGKQNLRRLVTMTFGNIPLFEKILSFLSLTDLLRIQAVHSHFKNTIERSVRLQRELFFKPAPFIPGKKSSRRNLLLAKLFPPLYTLCKPSDKISLQFLNHNHLGWADDADMRERMLRPEASWRRMFPVQPPAKLDDIFIFGYSSCIHREEPVIRARLGEQYQILQDEGLRMGLLFDLLMKMESLNVDPTFFVHWEMFPLVTYSHIESHQAITGDEEADLERAMDGDGPDITHQTTGNLDEQSGSPTTVSGNVPRPMKAQERWDDFWTPSRPELRHRITLYHSHDGSCGCGYEYYDRLGFEISSPFMDTVEKSPSTMLRYLNRTKSETWMKYGVRGTRPPKTTEGNDEAL